MDAAQLLARVSRSVHVLMIYRLLLSPKLMMAGSGQNSLDNMIMLVVVMVLLSMTIWKVMKTISVIMTLVMQMVIATSFPGSLWERV